MRIGPLPEPNAGAARLLFAFTAGLAGRHAGDRHATAATCRRGRGGAACRPYLGTARAPAPGLNSRASRLPDGQPTAPALVTNGPAMPPEQEFTP